MSHHTSAKRSVWLSWRVLLLPVLCSTVFQLLLRVSVSAQSTTGTGSGDGFTCSALPANNGGGNYLLCYIFAAGSGSTPSTLTVQVSADTIEAGGWVGFGFNTQAATMNGASVFIGWDGGTSADIFIGNFDTANHNISPSTTLDVVDKSVTRVDGDSPGSRTQLSFKINVNPVYISSSGDTHLIFARGPHPANGPSTIQQHQQGSQGNYLTFNFVSGALNIDSDPLKDWRTAHGFLMAFGWGFFITLGVVSARYLRPFHDPAWFHFHRIFMMIGLLLTTAGFIIALQKIKDGAHPTHRGIGITAMSLLFLQPVLGALRPHAPKVGESPSTIRFVWNIIHHNVGRIAYILAIINIFIGLSYFNYGNQRVNDNTKAFLVCFLFLMAMIICLEIHKWVRPDRSIFGKRLVTAETEMGEKDIEGLKGTEPVVVREMQTKKPTQNTTVVQVPPSRETTRMEEGNPAYAHSRTNSFENVPLNNP